MSQADLSIADQAGAAFRAEVNASLQALASLSSGATAPSTTYAYQYWLDTTTGQLKQRNAANSAWIVRATAAEAFTLSRSSNTILAEADRQKLLIATGSYTQTLTAAATLDDGWYIDVVVDSGVTLTLDPNSSETIDGATTKAIVGPAQGRVVCTGSLFRTIGFSSSKIVQVIEGTPNTTYSSITTTMPYDNSIPQNTEGGEVVTVTITPTSASSRLVIEAQFFGTSTSSGTVIALYQDSTAGAIAAGVLAHASDVVTNGGIRYEMAAGTTSATTFKLRAGNNSGATTYVNGSSGGRLFGGVGACRIKVTEISA